MVWLPGTDVVAAARRRVVSVHGSRFVTAEEGGIAGTKKPRISGALFNEGQLIS
ncbi:hypothetical protein D3C81_2110430 [compost metagenome]